MEQETEVEVVDEALADKIGAKFGADEVEDSNEEIEVAPVVEGDDETVKADEPEYVELDIDGKVYQVPKEIEKSILLHKDYTQKTQTLAQQRKELELSQQRIAATDEQYKFAASIQEELTQIGQLDAYLKYYNELDWRSMSTDEMVRTKHDMDKVRDQKAALVQTLSGKQTKYQQAQEQSRKELLSKSTEILKQRIPAWNDDVAKEVRAFALERGISEQDINSLVDPAAAQILWEAAQFAKLQKGVEGAKAKVLASPMIKTKARDPMPENVKQKLNLKNKLKAKGLSSQDKAKHIEDYIGERFS